MQIEKIQVVINPAPDVSVIIQPHRSDAVCCYFITVADMSLKPLKLIAVISAQTIPGREPHHPLPVLDHLSHMPLRQSVALVIPLYAALRNGDGLRGCQQCPHVCCYI